MDRRQKFHLNDANTTQFPTAFITVLRTKKYQIAVKSLLSKKESQAAYIRYISERFCECSLYVYHIFIEFILLDSSHSIISNTRDVCVFYLFRPFVGRIEISLVGDSIIIRTYCFLEVQNFVVTHVRLTARLSQRFSMAFVPLINREHESRNM